MKSPVQFCLKKYLRNSNHSIKFVFICGIHSRNPINMMMITKIKFAILTALLFTMSALHHQVNAYHQLETVKGGGELTAVQANFSTVGLSWTTTDAPFTVQVIDQSTFQVVQSFTTSNTWATVSRLSTGGHYTFIVTGTNYIVVDDLVML